MRPYRLLFAVTFALGACAPATAPAPGAPRPVVERTQPAQPPAATTPPAQPPATGQPTHPQPGAVPAKAPERWWLLDSDRDGVYGASVERAYRELLAGRAPRRTVTVAIIDSGVDVEHEDLKANVWQNPKERPNGRDDDGNGYIDDVHGWNFIGGKDGRHVKEDTYEVTRLYAACRPRLAGDSAHLPAAQRAEYGRCRRIEAAYREKRAESEAMLPQVRSMDMAVTRFVEILKQQLGTDSLTRDRVAALGPVNNDVFRAQQVYLQLDANSITPAMIKEERERLEGLMKYGLNPDFDPRPIVGDDYRNTAERTYGNADVTGPDASHGTGVAGIIGALRGNGVGVDGIAPAVRLMVVRAVPDGDERDKDVANAIRYAADNGAHIINMSFGKSFSPEKAAVDAAVKYATEKGVLLVHAAGNDGKDLAVEENYPNRTSLSGATSQLWLEVGASSWQGVDHLAADFSNYGREQVDLFAPGHDVLSTAPGNTYETASGTSFAAPVVSGIAALIMAYYPELSASDVRRVLLESSTRLGDHMVARPGKDDNTIRFGDLSVTGGVVNAYGALKLAAERAPRSDR
jgi:subtilisin family serine protease